MTWLIYGANGYTGEILARLAVAQGQHPVLAGRSSAITGLAEELGLEHRLFSLDAPELGEVEAVVHCAGPFSRTSAPMVAACLASGTHYLDLTGEISVFEAVYAQHDAAATADVALVPGVGFDVVPTDYLLKLLHAELPTATRADVALVSRGGFSGGTIRTVLEGMRTGGMVRAGGELRTVPTGHRSRTIRLGRSSARVTSVPLGDVSSGYRATHIPDITNFTNVPAGAAVARFDRFTRLALGSNLVYGALDGAASRLVKGPSEERRARTRSDLWAELSDDAGRWVRAAIRVPNTYDFTAHSALHAVRRTLSGVQPGAWTPSQAFGADFLTTIPTMEVEHLDA